MSGQLSKAIKSNIMNQSVKYKNNQEKIGEVIEVNKDAGTCTVSLNTRDGLNSIAHNVQLQSSNDGTISWFPELGDYVKVDEKYKRFIITGKLDLATMNAVKTDLYNDMYPDGTGGGCGFII